MRKPDPDFPRSLPPPPRGHRAAARRPRGSAPRWRCARNQSQDSSRLLGALIKPEVRRRFGERLIGGGVIFIESEKAKLSLK